MTIDEMQVASHVRGLMGLGYVKGLKPASHVGKKTIEKLKTIITQEEQR